VSTVALPMPSIAKQPIFSKQHRVLKQLQAFTMQASPFTFRLIPVVSAAYHLHRLF